MELKNIIQSKADKIEAEILSIRHELHQHPELSFQETNTSAYIRKLLDKWEIPYKYPFVENGILASIQGSKARKVVALRSDMDALPIQENTDLPYASINKGIMHACGHDVHMSALLGATKILSQLKDQIEGTILCIFQPGEEKLPGGARLMMEEGIFQELAPDYIIAQHVLPDMEAGKVGFRPGEYMASSDEIYLTVKGKGGHGALPEGIHDPVLMASNILISLQQEINRRSPKGTPTVLSFGKVVADGAVNVIPDEVRLEGTFRTMNESWRKKAHEIMQQLAEGIASGMGGSIDLEIRSGYPVLINDPKLTQICRSAASEMLGEANIIDMDIRMTAEDFAWFSHKYPSMLYRLGVKQPGTDEVFPLHTGKFKVHEDAIITGVKMMSWLALNALKN